MTTILKREVDGLKKRRKKACCFFLKALCYFFVFILRSVKNYAASLAKKCMLQSLPRHSYLTVGR